MSAAGRGLGVFFGAWKWKLLAAAIVALGAYGGVQHVRLITTKAALTVAQTELSVARSANESNTVTIDNLKVANAAFAEAARMNAERLEELTKVAEDAQRNAEHTRRELATRRELDRRAPACAALLDSSLAVCPDMVSRLREREAALGPH